MDELETETDNGNDTAGNDTTSKIAPTIPAIPTRADRAMARQKRKRNDMEDDENKEGSDDELRHKTKRRKLSEKETPSGNTPTGNESDKENEIVKKKQPKTKKITKKGNKKTKKKAKKTTKKGNKKGNKKGDDNEVNDKEQIDKMKERHRELLDEGFTCVVGTDEAGRGPLAGPVVIAAAYVPLSCYIYGITDSKKIGDEHERERLFEQIKKTPEIKYSITVLDHDVIDEINILEASLKGMRDCVWKLCEGEEGLAVDYALVDGPRCPRFKKPKNLQWDCVIKGDSKIYAIAAASICAKVTRDRLMAEYDKKFPIYEFLQNKGYPTPHHKATVTKHGPCEIHRKTFRPVVDWYAKHKPMIHEEFMNRKKQHTEQRKKEKKELAKKKKAKTQKGQKNITNFFAKKK